MLLGYNTNGFAHHDLLDAIDVLAEIGYRSVAITLDQQALNPFARDLKSQLARVEQRLRRHAMRSVIETGARFLLDPRTKHEPTLLTRDREQRQRRIDFLCHAIDIAAELESDCVSLWSGVLRDDISDETAIERLRESLHPVIQHASRQGVAIGFEPEPGMLIDTMSRFETLSRLIEDPCFRLTLDVGHLHCLGEVPMAGKIRQWSDFIINVHLEDMRAGIHEHLMFGQGEMDFGPILQAFRETDYRGGLHVELSRHSHDAPTAARQAYEFLTAQLAALDG